jgi:Tfp pilus assembly protein PilV
MSQLMQQPRASRAGEGGFTLVEVLLAGVLMAVALLAMAGMFVTGYANITVAGRSTNGLAAGRQILEDVRSLPFASIANLDGLDTDDPSTLPAGGPEREVARRWRHALAGDGVGWSFTDEELARWPQPPAEVKILGATGRIDVVAQSATLNRVTATIMVPGTRRNIVLTTLVANP